MRESKVQVLTDMLTYLKATTPGIEASAVVSVDGLMIASALSHTKKEKVAAMLAVMASLGEKTVSALIRGDMSELCIKGESGYVVLMTSGENAVLTALAENDARLGLVFLDMKRTAEEVAKEL